MNSQPISSMNQHPDRVVYKFKAYSWNAVEKGAKERVEELWKDIDTRYEDAMAMCQEWILEP